MSDLLALQVGSRPWHPVNSDLAEVYHRHDTPLIGVVRQGGVDYLFFCVLGELEPLSVWDYTLLHPEERQRIDDAESPEQFDAVVDALRYRPGVVAIAMRGAGVLISREYETSEQYAAAVHEMLERLEDSFESLRGSAERQDELCST